MAPRSTRAHRRARRPAATVVVGLALAGALPGAATAQDAAPGFCDRVRPGEVAGLVADAGLEEISGLAASQVHDDVLWAQQDSGSAPELAALDGSGADLGRHPVPGAEAIDWEDLAVGPGPDPDQSYLYAGDIGDNGADRPSVTVYRVPEPSAPPTADGAPLPGAEALTLTYPGGPADAEALLVDPRSGDLVIVTKEISGRSTVLEAAAASLVPGAPIGMTAVGEVEVPGPRLTPDNATLLPGTLVTGGDVSSTGDVVLLRTYRSVLAYERAEGASLGEALLGPPCFARQRNEPQGEAVAFSRDGTSYTTISEVQLARQAGTATAGEGPVVHRFEVVAPDAPLPTAPPGVGEEEGRVPWWAVPVGLAAVTALGLVGVGGLLRRRRRRR